MQRLLFSKVEVWLVALIVLFGLVAALLFGSALVSAFESRYALSRTERAVIAVAEVPLSLRKLLQSDVSAMRAYQDGRIGGEAGWTFAPGAAKVQGYHLLSRFDGDRKVPVVELVSLADGSVRYSWSPDIDRLLADANRHTRAGKVSNWKTARYRPYHPDLLPDGSLILKDTEAPLLRVDACGARLWINDSAVFHHSMEPDGEGGYWIPTVIEPPSLDHVPEVFLDEALARIDLDGRILEETSVAKVLIANGFRFLLQPPGPFNPDQMHLNDIQPVLSDGPYWKKGDLFLSFRHVSTLMLYRPSTGRIVWHKSGPWQGQHDIDILDDHRIAVFDNGAYNPGDFGRVDGVSEVVEYDFATETVSHPWKHAFERERVRALYEGLYTYLPGGGLLVEDHNSGRILIFDAEGRTVASYLNRASDGSVFTLGWGRHRRRLSRHPEN
ncbi:MAG: arylsulfotransferase family protein [Paracoccaceae bacterium]